MTASDAFPLEFLPGIRFGNYQDPSFTVGMISQTPHTQGLPWDGAWLSPDRRYCNPLNWLSASKLSITHSSISKDRQSGVVVTKLSVCLKANCGANDATCIPTKCYVSKQGKCVKFHEEVFPDYASDVTISHTQAAATEFAKGAYTECDELARLAYSTVIAGN
jgi:hypothetical protein